MTSDENILVEMLERVTNPERDSADSFAVQMFCMIVQSNIDLATKAHELIVKKMHSNNTTEACRSIGLLEECMSKAGTEFQKKTAKFTFLNELIALVLDKHHGPPAHVETKKRIMDCLMLWTVEHQDKSKIQEAYDNLRKQVNFDQDISTANSTASGLSHQRTERSSILGKDDELVAKLLKQGGSDNYKKANLLIQHKVNQETSRTEFICHLKSEIKKIEYTMEVFEQMLNAYTADSAEANNRDIIYELYKTCKKHNEQMARWPDFLKEGEPDFLEEVLNTRELLMASLQRFKEIFENEEQLAAVPVNSNSNVDLLSKLLGDSITTSIEETNLNKPQSPNKPINILNELNEIFGSLVDNVENKPDSSNLMNNLDLLEPESVFEDRLKEEKPETNKPIMPVINNRREEKKVQRFRELSEIDKLSEELFKRNLKEEQPETNKPIMQVINNRKEEKKVQRFRELSEIDKLSEELFKRNLKEEQRLQSFKKENKKLTLNDMVNSDSEKTTLNATKLKEVDKQNGFEVLTAEANTEDIKEIKQDLADKTTNQEEDEKQENSCLQEEDSNTKVCKSLTFKPLAEISVDLDEVTPLDEGQRLLLDDDDIQVTLFFTADRPSEHVSVIVMSVTNKSKLPVNDFQFEASVKKPCKVRLLIPTDVAMAPRKPFRLPAPIHQVVLLLNPTHKPVDVNCIISYKLGDDPDPIKELIVTKDIPYV